MCIIDIFSLKYAGMSIKNIQIVQVNNWVLSVWLWVIFLYKIFDSSNTFLFIISQSDLKQISTLNIESGKFKCLSIQSNMAKILIAHIIRIKEYRYNYEHKQVYSSYADCIFNNLEIAPFVIPFPLFVWKIKSCTTTASPHW